MESVARAQLDGLRLLFFAHFEEVLRGNWVKCRNEAGCTGNLLRVWAHGVQELRHKHVSRSVVHINLATGLLTSDYDPGVGFLLLSNFCLFWYAQVTNLSLRDYADFVCKLVDKVITISRAMSSIVRVKCDREREGVIPTYNFQLLYDLDFKSCALLRKQVAQLNRHCLFSLLGSLSHDCSLTRSHGIFIPLLCLLLLYNLCFYDFIVKYSFKLSEKRGLFQREHVCTLERIVFIWIQVGELDIGNCSGTSELALDIYLSER